MGRGRDIWGRDIWRAGGGGGGGPAPGPRHIGRAAGALPRTPEYFCREDGVWISAAVPSAAG
jgi:hypothetical protein